MSFAQKLFCAFLITAILFFYPQCSRAAGQVDWIQLNDDTINPVTAEYISNAIDRAQKDQAQCLVIELDTPGGLLNSTRTIVKKILSATIPVVVYIAPNGSRAGSAGVFITYASHIAAMAPSTNIGAAHPVDLGKRQPRDDGNTWKEIAEFIRVTRGQKENQTLEKSTPKNSDQKETASPAPPAAAGEDPLKDKILNDTVAFIKALAKGRGRNVDWAVKSVTQSASITAAEAVELAVVEFIAADPSALLQTLNGRTVRIADKTITLNTQNAIIQRLPMDSRQKFFNAIVNPNIAYIFMILGFYGLLFEVTHPGVAAPGILGAIFLILAFFSMQMLSANYAGLALIVLGMALFAAEVFIPGFGALFLGGAVCMLLGSLLLFPSAEPFMQISLSLVLGFTAFTAGLVIFLVGNVFRAHRRKAQGGQQGMIGAEGEVSRAISPGQEGKVFAHGELWNAVAEHPINKGEKVVILEINGLILKVRKK